MSETITLPKSAITLKKLPLLGEGGLWNYIDYRAIVGGLQLRVYQSTDGRWYESTPGGGYGGYATLDEATAALDREIAELRSALLPADAVVVNLRDAEERIKRACFEAEWRDVDREDWSEYVADDFDFEAKHILAALAEPAADPKPAPDRNPFFGEDIVTKHAREMKDIVESGERFAQRAPKPAPCGTCGGVGIGGWVHQNPPIGAFESCQETTCGWADHWKPCPACGGAK